MQQEVQKFFNFASNIAALLLFVVLDEVNYLYGIPMGIIGVIGAIMGSKFAMKKGSSYVRYLLSSHLLYWKKMQLNFFLKITSL